MQTAKDPRFSDPVCYSSLAHVNIIISFTFILEYISHMSAPHAHIVTRLRRENIFRVDAVQQGKDSHHTLM